ncbi:hypothetical protein [Phenylobacterium sp. SCN 70-31]|nr:hypothetical protein [Phenylobacterium sp. SCN 70-31]
MNTLDYATFFETHVRPRQRRRALFQAVGVAAMILSPVLSLMLLR